MPRTVAPLVLTGLVVVAAAVVAGLAGSGAVGPAGTAGPSQRSRDRPPPPRRAPADTAVATAARYALAARNWAPRTYASSWARQVGLAGGSYRRALVAARPGRRELAALRADGARSGARLLAAERDPRVPAPAARVLVTLDETTSTLGQAITGVTVNEVRLRRDGRRWRVVGWTVLPGR